MLHWTEKLRIDGFALLPFVASRETVRDLIEAMESASESGRQRDGSVYAIRGLMDAVPAAADFARSRACRQCVEAVLGESCFPVRATLFDKSAAANWVVPWHQDVTIAVRERREAPGFGPWTVKEGVLHVQPPPEAMEGMLSARLHLDPCGSGAGPLRVIPGSHRRGRLSAEDIASLVANSRAVTLRAEAGDLLLMRPLLLHASARSTTSAHRRVIHIDFASGPLPYGLEWHAAGPETDPEE